MKQFIAAAAFVAAQWQPAYAQAILGSIPEEFQGDWCWQEKTNGEDIFRCKPKAGPLSIDRMTLDTGRLSCVFDSGTASEGTRRHTRRTYCECRNTGLHYVVWDGPMTRLTTIVAMPASTALASGDVRMFDPEFGETA